ncbi:hypothetical protein [Roseicyclus sp.]
MLQLCKAFQIGARCIAVDTKLRQIGTHRFDLGGQHSLTACQPICA